jgi:hypothetical protein
VTLQLANYFNYYIYPLEFENGKATPSIATGKYLSIKPNRFIIIGTESIIEHFNELKQK